jgi:hypothetical protein
MLPLQTNRDLSKYEERQRQRAHHREKDGGIKGPRWQQPMPLAQRHSRFPNRANQTSTALQLLAQIAYVLIYQG